MSRRLTVLGTASQSPTLDRAQGGYLVEWDREKILFDPGEGSQVQLMKAGTSAGRVTRVCITHFHGDHCLGLPGVFLSHALAVDRDPLRLHYEPKQRRFVDRLLHCTALDTELDVIHEPIADGSQLEIGDLTMTARRLDHPSPTVGFRLEAPTAWHLLPDRLRRLGIEAEDRRRLKRHGHITIDGGRIDIEEVAVRRRGLAMAFVMDTRVCDSALQLAHRVDLLVSEATFLDRHRDLAAEHGHMTAVEAAELAVAAEVGTLVLSHFSSRYPLDDAFEVEARRIFPRTIAARDLDRIPIRRHQEPAARGTFGPLPPRRRGQCS